jgi:hypothetical protein
MRYAIFTLAALFGATAHAMGASTVHPNLRLQPTPYSTAARLQLGTRYDAYERIQTELLGLREEGLKLREADGGTLTDGHRAYLQTKFDAILAEQKRLQ